jgi:uncharacterized damage-inducible protein DinB
MREFLSSIEREYRLYKAMAEKTFDQVSDDQLTVTVGAEGNSIAVVVWHVSGNLKSRFTDFLATDGEKPWRDRESEFDTRPVDLKTVREKWEDGWQVLFATLATLTDDDLRKTVTIRAEAMPVHSALHRSLAHTASHIGQIVLLGKSLRGAEWRTLTMPRQKGRG